MYFPWLLVAMPLVGLFCAVYISLRDEKRLRAETMARSMSKRRRVTWISRSECDALLRTCEDVVIIDLTMRQANASDVLPSDRTLSLRPDQMLNLLKWLPPESSALVYGVSDVCALRLWTKRNLPGIAPIYVMTEIFEHSEIARGAA